MSCFSSEQTQGLELGCSNSSCFAADDGADDEDDEDEVTAVVDVVVVEGATRESG